MWLDRFKKLGKKEDINEDIDENNKIIEDEMLLQKEKQLEQKRNEQLKKQIELEYLKSSLLENLKNVKKISDELYSNDIRNEYNINNEKRVNIPENELLIRVNDHNEINPKYLYYINYIDFSFVTTTNLKVSGIDFSGTNISINPQTVYNKDLSNAKFGDDNIIFQTFEGCNLSGCDISKETESIGYENAIVDENTKIPIIKNNNNVIKR